MTDNDIKKALECCSMICACQLCPYASGSLNEFRCRTKLSEDALRLIKSQRLEIDTINAELRLKSRQADYYKTRVKDMEEIYWEVE